MPLQNSHDRFVPCELVLRSKPTKEALLNKCDMWYLYIIKKKDRHYTDITTDLKNCLRQHRSPPLSEKIIVDIGIFDDKL